MTIEDLGRLMQALNGVVLFAILLEAARRPRSDWPIFGKPP